MSQGCFLISQGYFKGVSRKFQGCKREVSRVIQGSFKGVSRMFQRCFSEVSRKPQRCFKKVSSKFKGVSRLFCFCKVYSCILAASQAEGGLVSAGLTMYPSAVSKTVVYQIIM